jgi:hypothetical protein
MENMEELHRELMISQKNDELTPDAKNMLVNYTKEVFDEWYDGRRKYAKIDKEKLLEGGRDFVFRYWKNFNGEKFQNPERYFKELFKRSVANFYYKNTKEYREKRFLESLSDMGMKILKFDLPYEIELDGPTIRKFSYIDKNYYNAEKPKKE